MLDDRLLALSEAPDNSLAIPEGVVQLVRMLAAFAVADYIDQEVRPADQAGTPLKP